MSNANQLVQISNKWVGYLEKKDSNNLESFQENAGYNNYTIFAKLYKDYCGDNFQGQPWCAMWVSCMFVEAFGLEKAKELLGGSLYSYCPSGAQHFRNKNRFFTNPQVGDVIFFHNGTREYHTGIVRAVDSSRVYTIEGNTSSSVGVVANGGGVFNKSYSLSYGKIKGYGRPNYDGSIIEAPVINNTPSVNISNGVNKSYVRFVQDWLNNKYGAGIDADGIVGPATKKAACKAVQSWLNQNYNSGLVADGIYGKNTKKSLVKAYQQGLNDLYGSGLTVDGIWGSNTKAATKVIKNGSSGVVVKVLQASLLARGYCYDVIDGGCGPKTEKSIITFQSNQGLSADGQAGKNTFEALYR